MKNRRYQIHYRPTMIDGPYFVQVGQTLKGFPNKHSARRYRAELRRQDAGTVELTPEGEQHVMPGCERQTTRAAPQGGLWD